MNRIVMSEQAIHVVLLRSKRSIHWKMLFLEKLTVTQTAQKFHSFTETLNALSHVQEFALDTILIQINAVHILILKSNYNL
jgi:hypothetical protein